MNEMRQLPAAEVRVETGPVRFGDDWPGLFIRGDDCFRLTIANNFPKEPEEHEPELATLLRSAILKRNDK